MGIQKNYKIHLEDIEKNYGAKRVLDNIDLSVSEGELCALVGPSGCGKSTLLRLILGQENPTRGIIKIENKAVGFPQPNRGIVFQRYSLFPHLSVLNNVLLGKRFSQGRWWLPWENRKDWLDEAMSYLERVRLSDAIHKYPHELSGGMKQRAAIAQALIMKPPVLLMDEPFGALDPDTREDLQLFLLDLWKSEKLTIFFITHDLEEACFIGSRLLILSQYYSDDRGDKNKVNRGGKIVADYQLKSVINSTKIKQDINFKAFIARVREEGFDPKMLQHVRDFNLQHPDSFQTLTTDENNI
ncbi:MAG: ABC transporter ATP-binding protein [Methylococcales bacterium]|nr:ABC transporter ATP-binding protein [Methylococcales bacterium]MCK5925458.1 ABC transporter ATP-binding protein [Methylococcales bacterium]